jgi:hypothetical protein
MVRLQRSVVRFLASIAAAFLASFVLTHWIVARQQTGATVGSPASAPERPVDLSANAQTEATPQPGSASPQPPANRPTLREALKGDDPLASAARVLAWLENTDAATFRKFAEDPKSFPTPYFSAFGREFQDAYCAAIAERWLALDPDGGFAAMQRVDEGDHFSYGPGGLIYSLARLRPELVLEKMPAKNRYNLQNCTYEALKTLAARDVKAAQRFAEQWKELALNAQARNAIIAGLAESDPLAAVALAGETKEPSVFIAIVNAAAKRGPLTFQQVVQAVGERLPPYAISPDLVLQHPELADALPNLPAPKNSFGLSPATGLDLAERFAPEERARLLASYDTLPAGPRSGVAAALACVWARTEPRAAADWAVAHGKPEDGASAENTAAQQVFVRWITGDADAALAWWRTLPDSPLRAAIGTNASTYLAEEGRIDEALAIFKPAQDAKAKAPGTMTIGGGSSDEQATVQLGQILAENDPATAGGWFAKLPPSVATYQTTLAFLPKWYAREPEAVARWIETLPAGSARDEATRTFIQEAARLSTTGASEWVATVTDADLRQSAAAMVYREMRGEDPAGAHRWLSELPGVHEAWRGGMLRIWR